MNEPHECQVCGKPIDRFQVPVCCDCGSRFAHNMDESSRLSREPDVVRARKVEAQKLKVGAR